jgi:hypothetical protein
VRACATLLGTLSCFLSGPDLVVVEAPHVCGSRLHEIEAWGAREVLATAVFCVAAVGAFLAAWIQLSCIVGSVSVEIADR